MAGSGVYVCADHLFKVLVIGDVLVGKSSVVLRYVRKTFKENYKSTIGVDFALKTIQWDARTVVRLQLWDIAGQEQTRNMSRVFYKGARGALVVFDVTKLATLESAAQWKQDLDSKVSRDSGEPIPTLLLANKCDLMEQSERDRMAPSLDEFCKDNGFTGWFETSAKGGVNIEEAMTFLIQEMMKTMSGENQDERSKGGVDLGGRADQSIVARCCC
uniref:Ras-related protein Rab n=1 Tax=Neogobius melanostomus TaxID=47308 RepID=A0A8C6WNF8_9GOBI